MWSSIEDRLGLLELLVQSKLKRRRSQATAWSTLAELPWTRLTGRRDELGLVETRRSELVALLNRVWPDWGECLALLTAEGLPPTPDGWGALEDAQRARSLPELSGPLNRRTAAALAAPHSKASLTPRRLAGFGGVEPTHDGSVRLRPPRGLRARRVLGSVDLWETARVLGEVSIPERALREDLELEGAVRAVLLVENLGAFCDLVHLEGWLLAHAPGWDTMTVRRLLERWRETPVIHFGDLDPNGVCIFRHLQQMRPDLRWFVPPFWEELIETRALSCVWPDDLDLQELPPLVQKLVRSGHWLEQEPLVVDPRTIAALEAML